MVIERDWRGEKYRATVFRVLPPRIPREFWAIEGRVWLDQHNRKTWVGGIEAYGWARTLDIPSIKFGFPSANAAAKWVRSQKEPAILAAKKQFPKGFLEW